MLASAERIKISRREVQHQQGVWLAQDPRLVCVSIGSNLNLILMYDLAGGGEGLKPHLSHPPYLLSWIQIQTNNSSRSLQLSFMYLHMRDPGVVFRESDTGALRP